MFRVSYGLNLTQQLVAAVETNLFCASDCTRPQVDNVYDQMYVKIGGGVQSSGGYSSPQITVVTGHSKDILSGLVIYFRSYVLRITP